MLPRLARSRPPLGLLLAAAVAVGLLDGCRARSQPAPPLVLETRIPLPAVAGRIDHLSLDPAGRRLFVAELGQGAVEVVDLARGRPVGRIPALAEPQGIDFLPGRGELAVATGGDGAVRFYRASDLAPVGLVQLGADADNVRIYLRTGAVVVGYGGGGLAMIEPATHKLVRRIALPAHPEAFQFDGPRVFVNLPDAGEILVADVETGRPLATWPNRGLHFNFPLALDPTAGEIAVVYRWPARLALLDAASGAVRQRLATCGDADDVWVDARRRRIYVTCGGGAVDVFQAQGGAYARTARIATRGGARTGLFSPELDRLYVAVPAGGGQPAAIWVYRPQ